MSDQKASVAHPCNVQHNSFQVGVLVLRGAQGVHLHSSENASLHGDAYMPKYTTIALTLQHPPLMEGVLHHYTTQTEPPIQWCYGQSETKAKH